MASPIICPACRTPLEIDENNPPADAEIVVCYGCGRDLGTYGALKAGIADAAGSEIERIVSDLSAKDPEWT
jgi:hypothetical protein